MTILTLGTFDCFHVGHVRLMQRAAVLGPLTVGVNSDRFVAEYKGQLPVIGEQDRLAVVRACRYVATALLNDGPGIDLIDRVQPDMLVIGSDWHECGYLAQLDVTQEWIDEHCVAILYLPRTPGVSSNAIRDRIS